MAEDVKNQTGLVKREGVYYFRARIPKELKESFGGKTEEIKSLRTNDKQKAQSKAAAFIDLNHCLETEPITVCQNSANSDSLTAPFERQSRSFCLTPGQEYTSAIQSID